jgi:RNA polymerase sigma-70 factor, ECF subfamily
MSKLSPSDEVEIMRRIIARDQTALSDLYDEFAKLVYGMAMRVLQNTNLAEEATQDAFMKVWQKAQDWNPERGKLVTWLLTIARYTAIDRLRKEQRQSPWTSIDLEDMLNLIGESDTDYIYEIDILKNLIRKLPKEQIEAVELAYFKGMSHREVAEYLKQPLGTIKSRIRDGLQL